jgi:hypothetical protein
VNQQNLPQNMNYTVLPTSMFATVSLIAGILGFVMLPILGSLVALWAGYAARKETRATPPTASGDGMATAGIVMGWIQIGLIIIASCCIFCLPRFGYWLLCGMEQPMSSPAGVYI